MVVVVVVGNVAPRCRQLRQWEVALRPKLKPAKLVVDGLGWAAAAHHENSGKTSFFTCPFGKKGCKELAYVGFYVVNDLDLLRGSIYTQGACARALRARAPFE
jgi:hypothetical protein